MSACITRTTACARRSKDLAGFHLELLGPLIADHPVIDMPARTSLFTRGEAADRFFLLLRGRIKLFTSDAGGAESIVQVFGPGDFFGLPAIVGLARYPVSAETVTAVRMVVMYRSAVLSWLGSDTAQVPTLLALLGRRYQAMADDLARLKVLSPRQRLCRYLLTHAEADLPGRRGPVEFPLPVPLYAVGGCIGLAPENVSRAVARLRGEGITVHRGRVRVEDLDRLRALAARGRQREPSELAE